MLTDDLDDSSSCASVSCLGTWQEHNFFVVRAGLEPDTAQDGLDNLTTSRTQMVMGRGVLGTREPFPHYAHLTITNYTPQDIFSDLPPEAGLSC